MSTEIVQAKKSSSVYLLIGVTLIAAIAGWFLPRRSQTPLPAQESALARIQRTKVLRIGYEGYPPYTIKDPNSGQLSGYSVDLANYIAGEAQWKVEWVQTSASTKIPDIQAGKYDMMVEPIYETIPRASTVSFTRPYAYFGYAAGVVRKGDTRFQKIEDLNKSTVTVAVRTGYTDQTYADQNLPLSKKRAMTVDDINQVFLDVLAKNSDIALADLESVKAFGKAHPDQVDVLFVDTPPALTPAGFMLPQGDFTLYNFLNSAIEYMETNHVFDRLDQKYSVSAFRERKSLTAPAK